MRIGLCCEMRAPDLGPGSATASELYAAAVEQCRWADERGVETVCLVSLELLADRVMPRLDSGPKETPRDRGAHG